MNRKDAELLVNAQFPDMDPVQRELVIRIMCGTKQRKTKHIGQKQKINGKTCYISAQVVPGHVGKKQRIYNSGSKGARLWREMEAKIRGNTTFLEGQKLERDIYAMRYDMMYERNIQRYIDNDPDHPLNKSKDKKGGK